MSNKAFPHVKRSLRSKCALRAALAARTILQGGKVSFGLQTADALSKISAKALLIHKSVADPATFGNIDISDGIWHGKIVWADAVDELLVPPNVIEELAQRRQPPLDKEWIGLAAVANLVQISDAPGTLCNGVCGSTRAKSKKIQSKKEGLWPFLHLHNQVAHLLCSPAFAATTW